jgi:hypothetical protein
LKRGVIRKNALKKVLEKEGGPLRFWITDGGDKLRKAGEREIREWDIACRVDRFLVSGVSMKKIVRQTRLS